MGHLRASLRRALVCPRRTTGRSLASKRGRLVSFLAVSGAECVAAFLVGGFRVVRRGDGTTTLELGYRVVEVPDVLLLTAEELDQVLRAAHVQGTEFLELLSRAFPADRAEPNETGVRPAIRSRDAG